MKIYNYHPDNGLYAGTSVADHDPMDADNWLIPAYATPEKPIEAVEHQAAVFVDNNGSAPMNHPDGSWRLIPDYRGYKYWLSDGSEHEIKELGIEPPDVALYEKPPTPIGDRRLNQRNILKSARESYIESALNGFQVRQQDRDRITRTVNRWDEGGFGESRDWIMADNSVQQVTKADLQDVLDAYDLREIEAFGIFNQLCVELENSDEPESITWPS